MDETLPDRKQAGIQSVEIAIRILEALAAHRSALSLTRLCEETDLQPSKLHRYLVSLVRTGMIVRSSVTGAYDLGPAARRIGAHAYLRFDGYVAAHDAAQILSDKTGHTVLLYAWNEQGVSLVRWEQGRHPISLAFRLGSTVRLSRSGAGRCFLAYLPHSVTGPILAREEEEAAADGLAPLPAGDLARATETIRRDGIYEFDNTLLQGMSVICAPSFDFQGEIAFVLAVIAHKRFLTPEAKASLVPLIDVQARELSVTLGNAAEVPGKRSKA